MLPGASRHVACASGTLSHARFVSLAVSGQVLDMHKSDLRDEEVGFAFLAVGLPDKHTAIISFHRDTLTNYVPEDGERRM